MAAKTRRRVVVDDSALAAEVGKRLRAARHHAGLTQQQLAQGRYTKAYVSALENGISKPSMAALHFFAGRLGIPPERLLREERSTWTRLEADLLLAAGRWQEAADAYGNVLDEVADAAGRADAFRGLAEARCRLDRGSEAIMPAAEATELFRGLGRSADAARSTYWLAFAHRLEENVAEARALLEHLLDDVRGGLRVEPEFAVRILIAIASIERVEGGDERALAHLEEAGALAHGLDDRRRATFFFSVAQDCVAAGDLEGAVRSGTESLALFRAADASIDPARVRNELALTFLGLGNGARAEEVAAEARRDVEQAQDGKQLASVAETQARIALASDRIDEAIAYANEAAGLAREHGNRTALAGALLTRARALVVVNRPEDALDAYRETAELVRELGSRTRLREVLAGWGDVLAALGRHAEAYALTRETLNRELPLP